MYQQRVPVYDKAMLVAFYFIENNTHLTLEGARGSTAVPLMHLIRENRAKKLITQNLVC